MDVVILTNVGDTIPSYEHAEEVGNNSIEIEWHHDLIREINQIRNREDKTLSSMLSTVESNDSNQSDIGTSSFAFPILGKEWIGSPVLVLELFIFTIVGCL